MLDFAVQLQLADHYVLEAPRSIPAGTTIRTTRSSTTASPTSFNPDPEQTVRWGEPSVSEMMGLWVEYVE